MGESAAHATPSEARSAGAVSILGIVGAAVLVGLGLTGLAYWLITFHWILLLSIVPLATGGLLFFSKATGPDHA
ncbi:MAG: hypothetical protein WBG19_09990 [Thermoplasmata archaeon]